MTYIATEEKWLHLAVLMDLYSRRIVGWHTASRLDRWLPLTQARAVSSMSRRGDW